MSDQVEFPIRWAFVPQRGEDGSEMIGIQLSGPFFSFLVAMPLDTGEQLAKKFPIALRAAIQQIRQSSAKLVVAPSNTLDLLRKKES